LDARAAGLGQSVGDVQQRVCGAGRHRRIGECSDERKEDERSGRRWTRRRSASAATARKPVARAQRTRTLASCCARSSSCAQRDGGNPSASARSSWMLRRHTRSRNRRPAELAARRGREIAMSLVRHTATGRRVRHPRVSARLLIVSTDGACRVGALAHMGSAPDVRASATASSSR
jgi:hypothetical protein